jgi:hypothetical protein
MKDEIIYTDDYALIVSDEHIKDVRPFMGQYHLEGGLTINKFPNYLTDLGACKLIIAHRPLTNVPILEGVALLPEFEDDDFLNTEIQIVGDNKTMSVSNFLKKYGKETYKYTEDDLVAVWNIAFNEGMSLDDEINEPVSFKDVIKSLQQPKRPKYFETVCDCQECGANKTNLSLDMGCENKIATTTNSQGQTELVGKYIF